MGEGPSEASIGGNVDDAARRCWNTVKEVAEASEAHCRELELRDVERSLRGTKACVRASMEAFPQCVPHIARLLIDLKMFVEDPGDRESIERLATENVGPRSKQGAHLMQLHTQNRLRRGKKPVAKSVAKKPKSRPGDARMTSTPLDKHNGSRVGSCRHGMLLKKIASLRPKKFGTVAVKRVKKQLGVEKYVVYISELLEFLSGVDMAFPLFEAFQTHEGFDYFFISMCVLRGIRLGDALPLDFARDGLFRIMSCSAEGALVQHRFTNEEHLSVRASGAFHQGGSCLVWRRSFPKRATHTIARVAPIQFSRLQKQFMSTWAVFT